MRGWEHLDLKPKEKLRGRGDGQATRVPHLRSLTGKKGLAAADDARTSARTAVLVCRDAPALPLHECADQDCEQKWG